MTVGSPSVRDADHRHPPQAERQGVGDGDDLHDAAVDQALHPLAHGGLRQPDRLAELGVRQPAVVLELLDDGPIDVVERVWAGRSHA